MSVIERFIPAVSLLLIPFLTIWLSHALDAGKDDFQKFQYASAILSEEKSPVELKNWALAQISSFLKGNGVPVDGLDVEKAKLYALVVGPILNKNKGVYCYNISSVLQKSVGDYEIQSDREISYFRSIDLHDLNAKQADLIKDYFEKTHKSNSANYDFLVSQVKKSCDSVDDAIDDMAKKTPDIMSEQPSKN